MPTVTEVLSKAEQVIGVFEATLDNTAKGAFGYEDMCGGTVPLASLDHSLNVVSNAAVTLTCGQAYNSNGSDVITTGLFHTRSLSDNFKGGAVKTVSDIQLDYDASPDNLHFRNFRHKRFAYKIGGKIDGVETRYADYPTYLTGTTSGRRHNDRGMSVSLSTNSPNLEKPFPTNKYTSGEAEGEAIPFVIGHVKNMKPIDLGSGLYQFHDGAVMACDITDIKAYDNGAELTKVAGDPSTQTPLTGEFMADTPSTSSY